MFTSSREKPKSSGNVLLPVAALVALVGGIGAAVLTHPKSKKVRDDLGYVTDELIDSLERVLDKVETTVQKGTSHGLGEVSQLIISAFDEIKTLNESAVDEPKGMAKVVRDVTHEVTKIEETVVQEVQKVETAAHHVEDDISEKIAWLQRRGRNLARKEIK